MKTCQCNLMQHTTHQLQEQLQQHIYAIMMTVVDKYVAADAVIFVVGDDDGVFADDDDLEEVILS